MIAIIILNYNNANSTIMTLKSALKIKMKNIIIIVDNASTDQSYNIIKREISSYENVILLKSDRNGGYSYGNNIGANYALRKGCDYLIICNNDIILNNECVEAMIKNFNEDKSLGVVGPKIVDLKNTDQSLIRKPLTCYSYILGKKPFSFIFKSYYNRARNIKIDKKKGGKFIGMVSGACFMIKSTIFKEINGFDENVFLFAEEDILSCKLKEKKIYTYYNPNVSVIHIGSLSINNIYSVERRYIKNISELYYLKKYANIHGIYFYMLKLLCFLNIVFSLPIRKKNIELANKFLKYI